METLILNWCSLKVHFVSLMTINLILVELIWLWNAENVVKTFRVNKLSLLNLSLNKLCNVFILDNTLFSMVYFKLIWKINGNIAFNYICTKQISSVFCIKDIKIGMVGKLYWLTLLFVWLKLDLYKRFFKYFLLNLL